VTGATDGDASHADGEELRPLTNDADRKQVRVTPPCYQSARNIDNVVYMGVTVT